MRRLLLVEDDQGVARCLERFFEGHGFTVVSVFSGEEALERIDEVAPEVIVLDILLPGVTGIEVLKRVKAARPQARVVMVTGLPQEDLQHEARHYGACDFVTKPFDFSAHTWAAILQPPSNSSPLIA